MARYSSSAGKIGSHREPQLTNVKFADFPDSRFHQIRKSLPASSAVYWFREIQKIKYPALSNIFWANPRNYGRSATEGGTRGLDILLLGSAKCGIYLGGKIALYQKLPGFMCGTLGRFFRRLADFSGFDESGHPTLMYLSIALLSIPTL